MEISLFEVTGPVMVGPSSSHTAGAARLALVAQEIAGAFDHVSFGLHGSFAKTYRGHGTDKALVAGVLGLSPQDERLRHSFELAKERGVTFDFYEAELDGAHENTVSMTFVKRGGEEITIVASSLGGGRIRISRIGDYPAEITAEAPTLVVVQRDQRGMVSEISRILSVHGINIGMMRLTRTARGEVALCVLETDSALEPAMVQEIARVPGVLSARAICV